MTEEPVLMHQAFVRCMIQFYAKELITHLFSLATFAQEMSEKHPEESDAVFGDMEDPKPKSLKDLIDGTSVLLYEIILQETNNAI